MDWHQRRYLFGCCSVPARDPATGDQVYRYLHQHRPEVFSTEHPVAPLPALDCLGASDGAAAASAPELPGLLEGYLRLGALLCGPPALDRAFGTVDFFMLLDLENLPPAPGASSTPSPGPTPPEGSTNR